MSISSPNTPPAYILNWTVFPVFFITSTLMVLKAFTQELPSGASVPILMSKLFSSPKAIGLSKRKTPKPSPKILATLSLPIFFLLFEIFPDTVKQFLRLFFGHGIWKDKFRRRIQRDL